MKPSPLTRRIGLWTAILLIIANMIGTGIFTTSGIMAAYLADPLLLMGCWLLGGIIAMAGALSYAELATRMPAVGGEYVYLKRLYHPLFGFLTGWTSFIVGFSAPIAAAAYSFSVYFFQGAIGENGGMLGASQNEAPVLKSLAIGLIILFTGLHYLGVQQGSRIQNSLTVLKIIIIIGLAMAGLFLGDPAGWASGQDQPPAAGTQSALLAFGTVMMLVMFSYAGWNASTYIAGEMKEPRRSLPLSLVVGTGCVTLIYLAFNLFIFKAVPLSELQGQVGVVQIAVRSMFGAGMDRVLSLLIAMAGDGLFFRWASEVNPRTGVPGKSILIQGIIASLLVGIGSFEQLLIYMGFALSVFPVMAVAGVFIARRRHVGDDSAVRVPGYPITPVFFLLSSLFLMTIAFLNRPLESSAALITVAMGIPAYWFVVRYRSSDQDPSEAS